MTKLAVLTVWEVLEVWPNFGTSSCQILPYSTSVSYHHGVVWQCKLDQRRQNAKKKHYLLCYPFRVGSLCYNLWDGMFWHFNISGSTRHQRSMILQVGMHRGPQRRTISMHEWKAKLALCNPSWTTEVLLKIRADAFVSVGTPSRQ